ERRALGGSLGGILLLAMSFALVLVLRWAYGQDAEEGPVFSPEALLMSCLGFPIFFLSFLSWLVGWYSIRKASSMNPTWKTSPRRRACKVLVAVYPPLGLVAFSLLFITR
ncbi:MAG: hypothetical protein O6952_02755, partial [Planctomycetota bacterium]|nr:hypothetical protein [Planctomycetota bacterium]